MSIIALLIISYIGLLCGSFINALVWRLHEQLDEDGETKILSKNRKRALSIVNGRSMCPSCKHVLSAKDLIPIVSWIMLRGRCRYCKTPISKQYPIIELLTTVLFATSYLFWPRDIAGEQWVLFGGWLVALVLLIALAIYDLKWFILPSKLIYIGIGSYVAALLIYAVVSDDYDTLLWSLFSAMLFLFIFFFIFMVSTFAINKGWSSADWLGFGDVRLAFLLGLLIGEPLLIFVAIFIASIIGLIISLPGVINNKMSLTTKIPFGPYLIAGTFVTVLWGAQLISWYETVLIGV